MELVNTYFILTGHGGCSMSVEAYEICCVPARPLANSLHLAERCGTQRGDPRTVEFDKVALRVNLVKSVRRRPRLSGGDAVLAASCGTQNASRPAAILPPGGKVQVLAAGLSRLRIEELLRAEYPNASRCAVRIFVVCRQGHVHKVASCGN